MESADMKQKTSKLKEPLIKKRCAHCNKKLKMIKFNLFVYFLLILSLPSINTPSPPLHHFTCRAFHFILPLLSISN